MAAMDCDHATELRQVVGSLKDLKTCLCKLINVQKKQIELEIERAKGNKKSAAAADQEPTDVVVGRVGKPLAHEDRAPAAANPEEKSEPQGASVDIKLQTTTSTPKPTTTEKPKNSPSTDERPKRSSAHSSMTSSDFHEIDPDELSRFMNRGFTTDSVEEFEKKFLNEHPASEPGAASITVGQDRKVRGTEAEEEDHTEETEQAETHAEELEEDEEEVVHEVIEKKAIVVKETVIAQHEDDEEEDDAEHQVDIPVSPKKLTATYNQMEKKKKLPKASLPRQQTMEFPTGSTYYNTGDNQKPMDYTLNLPQQTFYFVPGPVPGQNKLVAAPHGNYDQEPAMMDSQAVSPSLNAQYAPVAMPAMTGMEHMDHHAAPVMMPGGGYGGYPMYPGGDGGHVQYLPYPEEEQPVAPPKEKRKRRKSKKKTVETTTATAATTEAAEE